MRSPGPNRVQIIGEEGIPGLDCPQRLPERLKRLLKMLEAAEQRQQTRQRQAEDHATSLHVEVRDDEILITLPGTDYAVKYRKLAKQLHGEEYPLQVDRRSPLTQAEFIAKAWELANKKARELGWLA